MKDDPKTQLQIEKALSDAIHQLPREAAPRRDLWPEIEAQLAERVQSVESDREIKGYKRNWIPVALAASVLLSFTALWMSWNNLQSAKQFYNQGQQFAGAQTVVEQIKTMEHEYGLAKSALLTQIALNASSEKSSLITEIQSNLLIIDQATSELKAAIIKQPDNPDLLNLLNATYQQELAVLSQLAKLNQES